MGVIATIAPSQHLSRDNLEGKKKKKNLIIYETKMHGSMYLIIVYLRFELFLTIF